MHSYCLLLIQTIAAFWGNKFLIQISIFALLILIYYKELREFLERFLNQMKSYANSR